MRAAKKPAHNNPVEVELWWVRFAEPADGLFAKGEPEQLAVTATLYGMRRKVRRTATDRPDIEWYPLDGAEYLVAGVGHMPSLMAAVRRTGLHGWYRKAGGGRRYPF